jgi:cytoskeletal protein CcmA (bactofilin family)
MMPSKDVKNEGKLGTIIGKGTRIEGTMSVDGATRIDGIVSGKLISNDVITIGPTGEVKAEVKARSIIVGGKVQGNLEAEEKIELQSKAELKGDLIAKSLLIEHGAVFHGTSNMMGKPGQIALPGSKPPVPEEKKV